MITQYTCNVWFASMLNDAILSLEASLSWQMMSTWSWRDAANQQKEIAKEEKKKTPRLWFKKSHVVFVVVCMISLNATFDLDLISRNECKQAKKMGCNSKRWCNNCLLVKIFEKKERAFSISYAMSTLFVCLFFTSQIKDYIFGLD